MSKSLKRQIVKNARALIQDERHWCRGETTQTPRAAIVMPLSSAARARQVSARLAWGAQAEARSPLISGTIAHTQNKWVE